jgi:hypothetical protein
MLGGQSGEPLALVYGKHNIPPLGERERHLPRATPDLEDTSVGGERRKSDDALDDLFWVARSHLVIELGRIIELPGQSTELRHVTQPPHAPHGGRLCREQLLV